MQVKSFLQDAFESWGLPQVIRVDNGIPRGTNHSSPSAMALWLAGLGVEMHYGRPAQSTDNAIVERCHGVLNKWVNPEGCADLKQLQDKLDWASFTQRERYRSPQHLTRAEAYPALYDNKRHYRRSSEQQQWQHHRLTAYLRRYCFERKVGKYGQISLFSHSYSVGRSYARQLVTIILDCHRLQWVFYDEQDKQIKRHDCKELVYEQLANLSFNSA